MQKPKSKVSLDSFYDAQGFHRSVCWGVTLTANLGMLLMGYTAGVLNTIQSYISNDVYKWNSDESILYGGLMNSMLCGGGAVGAFFGGVLAKSFGRKNTMIIADVFGVIGAACTTIASLPLLLAGRALIGIAAGINSSVVPLYVSEVNPLPIRGPTGSAIQTAASTGTLVSLLLGFGMPQDGSSTNWWRFMLGLPALFCIVRTVLLLTVYAIEPAKFLLSKGREEEAETSLGRIYLKKYVQEQKASIKAEIEQQSASKELKLSDLLTPRWRHRFLIGLFVAAAQQLTFVNGIVFYSTTLFLKTTHNQLTAQILTCVMIAFTLIANFCAGVVISKVGRKAILLVGAIITALLWASVTVFLKFELETAAEFPFFGFFIVFGVTYGPVPWIFVAEVLPDVAVGMALFLNYAVQIGVAQSFPIIINSLPISGFLIPAAIALVIFLVVLGFMRETKDKTPHEIADIYYSSGIERDQLAQTLIVSNKITEKSDSYA